MYTNTYSDFCVMSHGQHNMRESCKNSLKLSFRNTWPQKHTDKGNAEKTGKRCKKKVRTSGTIRYHQESSGIHGHRIHRVRERGSCSTTEPSQQMSIVAAKRCGIILKSLAHSRTARKPSLRAGRREVCSTNLPQMNDQNWLKKVNYLISWSLKIKSPQISKGNQDESSATHTSHSYEILRVSNRIATSQFWRLVACTETHGPS